MQDLEKFPWLFPTRDAVPFDLNKSLNLPGTSPLTLLDYIPIPAVGYEGVIRYIELTSSDFGTSSAPDSYYQFQMGTRPLQYYSKITQPMMATTPVLIFLNPNLQFSIFATNLVATTVALRYRLTGWYYRPVGGS